MALPKSLHLGSLGWHSNFFLTFFYSHECPCFFWVSIGTCSEIMSTCQSFCCRFQNIVIEWCGVVWGGLKRFGNLLLHTLEPWQICTRHKFNRDGERNLCVSKRGKTPKQIKRFFFAVRVHDRWFKLIDATLCTSCSDHFLVGDVPHTVIIPRM